MKHEERIRQVEHGLVAVTEQVKTLFNISKDTNEALRENSKNIQELTKSLNAIGNQMAVLVTQNAGRKECPNPGACNELDSRIRELENERTSFVGSWKGILFVFSCAAAFLAVAGTVLTLIKTFWVAVIKAYGQ